MIDNVYSITQINSYIKLILEEDFLLNNINLEGEISNFKEHSSGHLYFSLKDANSSINVVMFKSYADNINLKLKNGLKVVCKGSISLYLRNGQYQFYAQRIKSTGSGDIFANFEALKQTLLEKGLFDEVHKKAIPEMPKVIGVITSSTGAAIRDILNVSKRRNPNVKIIVIPSLVQGNDAPKNIIEAIEMANDFNKHCFKTKLTIAIDTLILARGGGSKEDIWAFNDENVAYAIFNSKIPIVTGIGHEVDFTIADFVADLRASTPSSAMEVVLPEISSVKSKLHNNILAINREIDKKLYLTKNNFNSIILTNSFCNFPKKIEDYRIFSENITSNLQKDFENKLVKNKMLLDNSIDKINLLSPLNILKNGYSLVTDLENKTIKSKNSIKAGDEIKISFFDGDRRAEIKD